MRTKQAFMCTDDDNDNDDNDNDDRQLNGTSIVRTIMRDIIYVDVFKFMYFGVHSSTRTHSHTHTFFHLKRKVIVSVDRYGTHHRNEHYCHFTHNIISICTIYRHMIIIKLWFLVHTALIRQQPQLQSRQPNNNNSNDNKTSTTQQTPCNLRRHSISAFSITHIIFIIK